MADRVFACPDCEKTFPTASRLERHQRMSPNHSLPTSTIKAPGKKPLDPDGIVDAAVENLRTDGALLAATIAPHVGVAIHGVEGERKGEWIVKSRAVMFGNLIRERARKEARLLRLLVLFNQLHDVPEGIQILASMGAAIAVDTGRLAPDQEIAFTLAGREMKIAPVRLAIPDVVDYVASQTGPAEAAPPSANGRVGEPEPVAGGVENT